MMLKFFVSYSRSVKSVVQGIVDLLRATGHEVWWDGDIPVIADWWATILDKIESCNVFIFVVSEKAVQSPYCLAELKYATERNRAILPIIIDDHSKYAIPPEVTPTRQQWLDYDGKPENLLTKIIKSCGMIDWDKYDDIPVARPPEPNTGTGSLTKRFQQAIDLAHEGHFAESIKRLQNIASNDKEKWGMTCKYWIRRLHLYTEIVDLADHTATLKFARDMWKKYEEIDDDLEFDPFALQEKLFQSSAINKVTPPTLITILNVLLSQPFDLINIPRGSVSINTRTEVIPTFQITKYPITNGLFQKFVNVEGYLNPQWWTYEGWQEKEWEAWEAPAYLHDNHPQKPVVGVSWYEAVAFCLWLSDVTGSDVMLPTDGQWQRAAQGDDRRIYPWGDEWSESRCNNGCGHGKSWNDMTTNVTLYEGKHKSDSYFGVVDMAGNVWEWCRTIYGSGSQELEYKEARVIRGGSWEVEYPEFFRCDMRLWSDPRTRHNTRGFRVVVNTT